MPSPSGSDALAVHLTVDVGPADAVLGRGNAIDADWSATMSGAQDLFDVLDRLADRLGSQVGSTWFIRADRLIEAQFGDRLAVLERFAALAAKRGQHALEIGWMPQIYGPDSAAIDYDDLDATHDALRAAGYRPASVRMGNCYHDNRTMHALASLGIAYDSSALPGRTKNDGSWRLDWSVTPEAAFHPAADDYRQPGTPALDITEVPLTMLPIKADYDAAPLRRYVNPAMHPALLWPGLDALLAGRDHLVLITHPDELHRRGEADGHPLIAYSPAIVADNLLRLVESAGRMARRLEFLPLRDLRPSATAMAAAAEADARRPIP